MLRYKGLNFQQETFKIQCTLDSWGPSVAVCTKWHTGQPPVRLEAGRGLLVNYSITSRQAPPKVTRQMASRELSAVARLALMAYPQGDHTRSLGQFPLIPGSHIAAPYEQTRHH